MSKVLYVILTFLESGLSVFGIRATLEQAPYRVVATLAPNVELRSYGPLKAVETEAGGGGDAFSRLFRYITGANRGAAMIAMTAPVEQSGGGWLRATGRAGPDGTLVMRFFLPKALAADPPQPTDPRVRLVTVPARTVAVIRFSGSLSRANVESHLATLRATVARTGRKAEGAPYLLGYDPPFTIPVLRRNEVAVDVSGAA